MTAAFDYVIAGAGSAGCVLAARLSEDPAVRVLLLEAGPPDRSIWIHLPIGYGKTMWSPRYNWCFHTDPDPNMNGRRIYWPRGKTLGGSSAINGLIYIRGQHEDYDLWSRLGNRGWGHEEVLTYFIRSETNQRGAGRWHGDRGPLRVSDIAARHELIDAFVAGAGEIGVPRNDDFNGAVQEGAGYYQLTTHNGLRSSSATAYLRPARGRPNLTVLCEARALRIVIRNGRATGIEYLHRGERKIAIAEAEVLLSAGAIQSPLLLQLSGVGPASLLRQHGIEVLTDAPGVGENLQDHLQIRLGYECAKPITTNDQLNSWVGQAAIGLQWLLRRQGPLAIGINQGGCFMRAVSQAATPDIQFHVATLSADMAGGKVHPWSGFTMSICQLRPESRGRIRITSADPLAIPSMQPNYLATDLDRATVVAGIKAAREIAATSAMAPYVRSERKPGLQAADDQALLQFARDSGATIFHPSGTCMMGAEADPQAVLDERLRVRGIHGLRVVDCSAMPTLVSGNTNAPVIMMAEKAVDMIRQDAAGVTAPRSARAPARGLAPTVSQGVRTSP